MPAVRRCCEVHVPTRACEDPDTQFTKAIGRSTSGRGVRLTRHTQHLHNAYLVELVHEYVARELIPSALAREQ